MRKVLIFLFVASIGFARCSKDISYGDPTNVRPYVGVFSDDDYEIYDDPLFGRLHVYDVASTDSVFYGIPLIMNNKAFTYKLEYAKVIRYSEVGGKGFYIHIDNDDIVWISLDNGSEPQGVSKGKPIEYKMKMPVLDKGGYQVRMTTICDGEIENMSEWFCVNDLSSIIPIYGQ